MTVSTILAGKGRDPGSDREAAAHDGERIQFDRAAADVPSGAALRLTRRTPDGRQGGRRRPFDDQSLFSANVPADYYPRRGHGGHYREQRLGTTTRMEVLTTDKAAYCV
jgi:hypothetical protein